MANSHETDAAILRQVAKWIYDDDLTKTEVAERLFSKHLYANPKDLRPLNAMLKEAKTRKLVRIQIPDTVIDCGPARDLQDKFPHLREIITVPWYDQESYGDLLRRFAVAAAEYFETIVKSDDEMHVGITGGETLFEFCEAVSADVRENVHVYTTALVGRGPLSPTASHIDPIVNAALLWAKCGRLNGHIHYATVPPYGAMNRDEIRRELEELSKRQPIRETLQSMDKINVAFAGLGLVKPDTAQLREGIGSKITMTGLLQGIVSPEQLEAEGAVAEFSNCFLDASGSDSDDKWNFFLSAGHYDPQRRGAKFFRRMLENEKTVVLMAGYCKEEALKVVIPAKLFNVWITDEQTLMDTARFFIG